MDQIDKKTFKLTRARLEARGFFSFADRDSKIAFDNGFRAGWSAAMKEQEKKLDAYAAFLRGELTQDQLNEALNG